MYKGGSFKFTFDISEDYPHKPPKVKCVPKVSFQQFGDAASLFPRAPRLSLTLPYT